MFEFTFSKVKVDCFYLNKDPLKPKKENCWEQLKKYSVYMCIMFYSFRFQKMTKNRIQVLVFISPFFSWSFLASLLQLFFGQFTHLWIVPLLQYHLHQNNKSVICYVVFLFWDHDGGTGPKMEPMLDFNESAKNNWK